jgi:septum formation inhibitor-activating ATPase MinD
MKGSSPTVAMLATQLVALRDAQDDMRALVVDVLKEMLKISQVQAESNLKMLQLIENQTAVMQAFTNQGPGTSRTRTDESEAQEWREQMERELRESIGDRN